MVYYAQGSSKGMHSLAHSLVFGATKVPVLTCLLRSESDGWTRRSLRRKTGSKLPSLTFQKLSCKLIPRYACPPVSVFGCLAQQQRLYMLIACVHTGARQHPGGRTGSRTVEADGNNPQGEAPLHDIHSCKDHVQAYKTWLVSPLRGHTAKPSSVVERLH
jgi:hypothetical protein